MSRLLYTIVVPVGARSSWGSLLASGAFTLVSIAVVLVALAAGWSRGRSRVQGSNAAWRSRRGRAGILAARAAAPAPAEFADARRAQQQAAAGLDAREGMGAAPCGLVAARDFGTERLLCGLLVLLFCGLLLAG